MQQPEKVNTITLEQSDGGFATMTIGRVPQWRSTEILCVKDGEILQLWIDSYGQHQDREWRRLPSFDEASVKYDCTVVK